MGWYFAVLFHTQPLRTTQSDTATSHIASHTQKTASHRTASFTTDSSSSRERTSLHITLHYTIQDITSHQMKTHQIPDLAQFLPNAQDRGSRDPRRSQAQWLAWTIFSANLLILTLQASSPFSLQDAGVAPSRPFRHFVLIGRSKLW